VACSYIVVPIASVFRATGVHEEAADDGPGVQGEKRDNELNVGYAHPDFLDKHANGETMQDWHCVRFRVQDDLSTMQACAVARAHPRTDF
jgi:hypothetical protein